jgi:hypothetical protein
MSIRLLVFVSTFPFEVGNEFVNVIQMKFLTLRDKWRSNEDKLWINFIVQTFIPAVDYSRSICLANIYSKVSRRYPKYSIIIGTTKESLVLKLRLSVSEARCCLASKSI